ncbi:MAG: LCP family protein [Candidatus Paceibacterota bacterium]
MKSRITNRNLGWFALAAIVCAVIIGLLAVPPRNASWKGETGLQRIGKFFNNIFTPQPITLLILGRPGDTYNGGTLTDSLMVVRYDPDQNMVYLVSIPRDLWISSDTEQFKINEAFRKNKVDLVLERAHDITGFNIDGYVIIDLSIARDVVDAVGGVDITLKEPATDWVSGYTLNVGTHHLNGEDAVWLMRNRYNPQGDFFREGNQQEIIDGVLKKVKKMSTEDKLSLVKEFLIDTDIFNNANVGISRIMPYVSEVGTISNLKTKNIVLDFTTKLFTSSFVPVQGPTSTLYSSVLIPTEGFEKYDKIREYIQQKTGN